MITLKLSRKEYGADGILSELTNSHGDVIACCLEHSYNSRPKLYLGTFTCKRGQHKLHSGPAFEAFEIEGVKGHDNILFHYGNFNKDSEGCVLVGEHFAKSATGEHMVTNSRATFKHFMDLMTGVDSFTLEVT